MKIQPDTVIQQANEFFKDVVERKICEDIFTWQLLNKVQKRRMAFFMSEKLYSARFMENNPREKHGLVFNAIMFDLETATDDPNSCSLSKLPCHFTTTN